MVRSIIQKHYEQQLKNERPPKKFDIQDFIENRKSMVEVEISKVHKQITNIKYPTWHQNMRNMKEEQLKAFIARVDNKIRACDDRINMLKSKQQKEVNLSFMQNTVQTSVISSHPSQIILDNNNKKVDFPNSINQGGEASNLGIINKLVNMQQGDACFSFVPNMIQESANATSSYPSQVIHCLHNISQSQPILEALKSLNRGTINWEWETLSKGMLSLVMYQTRFKKVLMLRLLIQAKSIACTTSLKANLHLKLSSHLMIKMNDHQREAQTRLRTPRGCIATLQECVMTTNLRHNMVGATPPGMAVKSAFGLDLMLFNR
ncbi:hypothetical protein VNO78_33574 [Psophocarpus tetragonolobus]|uniref:Uncharacterized protein n=1 Tax=Psophocarpus tetragonolobus TaxID=3891 RepID=A0AAN9RLG5_PSOTE